MARKQPGTPGSRSTARARDVGGFLAQLEHPRKAEIDAVRALIRSVDDRIREEVKWNAPSFLLHEHFATFKLHPVPTVQVVLHTGTKARPDAPAVTVDDPAGMLKWAARDRAVVTFNDGSDVDAKSAAFLGIVRQWVAHVDALQGHRSAAEA